MGLAPQTTNDRKADTMKTDILHGFQTAASPVLITDLNVRPLWFLPE
jgi:hypothetical protein